MTSYFCKINSVFKRDNKGRFTDEWSDPRFEELKDEPNWRWYYKWDGTSVGACMSPEGDIDIFGRGTKTKMPDWQREYVEDWSHRAFGNLRSSYQWLHIYGELVGPKVQGNPHGLEELQVVEFARGVPGRLPWPSRPDFETRSLSSVIDSFYLGGDYPCHPGGFYEGVVGWFPSGDGLWTKLKVKDKWA